MLVMDEESPLLMKIRFSIWIPDFQSRITVIFLNLTLIRTETFAGEENIHQQEQTADDAGRKKNLIQSELIDKFILANPRIEPVRDPSKIPAGDISKPFAEKEGGFVTETLARIYINQGYYSKAIDIYKELSLKFPEKSSYFASQIELVKVYLKK